ncbi:MAG TPA: transglycosylase SLT domain-containing protein [Rhodopila sp.]|nr:transglycosylase SLT domain-containing protein [Rhodopila sp.]
MSALAACGGQQTRHATLHHHYRPGRYYPPPGPPSDPWGPYIHEASGRYGVPEQWIRAVMHQESGGQEDVISWAGAMGLMQVMPDTYDGLRSRYSLGDDPFDPHNNILAGTAYLREMYDRFGAPGFLAAYNAGPNRVDRYLNTGAPLPSETVNYVASIAPRLGPGTPMSGPLAVYAGGGTMRQYAAARTSSGCDPDAAYNPDGPCSPARPAVLQPAVLRTAQYQPAPVRRPTPSDCDPDAAYDPTRPCQPRPAPVQEALASAPPRPRFEPYEPVVAAQPLLQPTPYARSALPQRAPEQPAPARPTAFARTAPEAPTRTRFAANSHMRPIQESMAQPVSYRQAAAPPQAAVTRAGVTRASFPPAAPSPAAQWAIQVGAYPTLSGAEAAADSARTLAPDLLRKAKTELPATAPLGNKVAFRARLAGLTPTAASSACSRLSGHGLPCITVPPTSF